LTWQLPSWPDNAQRARTTRTRELSTMQRRRMLAGLTAGLALSPLARSAMSAIRTGADCTVASDHLFRDGFEPAGLVPDVADYYLPQQLCFIGWDQPAFAH